MKIICMDCQTESDVDPEMVKGKKHIECDVCAADFRTSSASMTAEPVELSANADAEFNPEYLPEQLPEDNIQWLDDENVLDISAVPFAPSYPELMKGDDLISLAPDETKAAPAFEETSALHTEEAPASSPLPESSFQLQSEPESVAEEPTPEALAETHLPEAVAASVSDKSEKVKLASLSAPKLLALAATLMLFISLAGVIGSQGGNADLKAQSPAPASPVEKKVEQRVDVATSAPTPEMSKPAPSPSPEVTQENSSSVAAAMPPANQSVNEPATSQPAASEPAAVADDARISVQVGSHNQMGLAESQAEKLRGAGYEPRVVSVEIPKRGRWHRVQVGNFSDRREAQQFGAQLVSKGVVESFVIADK